MRKFYDLQEAYASYPNIKPDDIQSLLEWTKAQPHLPVVNEHEALLFFHGCKFRMDYAQNVIDLCFTFRTQNGELFDNLDIETPQMEQVQKTIAIFPLSKKTPEGHVVFMGKLMDTDPANFDIFGNMKIGFMSYVWLLENGLIPGFQVIIDVSGATFGHLTRHFKKAMSFLQANLKTFNYLQEAFASQIIGIHLINTTPIIEKIMTIVHKFVRKEIINVIHVHRNVESVYQYIPRDMLPKEYGGLEMNAKDSAECYYQYLREHRLEIMEYMDSHRVNEELRPVKSKNNFSFFGKKGSFKRLDID